MTTRPAKGCLEVLVDRVHIGAVKSFSRRRTDGRLTLWFAHCDACHRADPDSATLRHPRNEPAQAALLLAQHVNREHGL